MSRVNNLLLWLAPIALVNLLNILTTFNRSGVEPTNSKSEAVHSYVAGDFPEFWDMEGQDIGFIAIPVQETRHYPVTGDEATMEWASYTPPGSGYLRLGPERRDFALAMTHEDHCLRIIRAVLANPSLFQAVAMPYCFNYIRQMILCSPNLTLESPRVLSPTYNITTARHGAVHVCKDWRKVYEALTANWEVHRET
ncbi:hydrolase-4 domain-containing protein [Favolaschia claudopus]|uniref:Hydrolase-4 domain-containing protein n=1 Tax=Favolaschia claudopus TaxID=2862362 RepID=A0AAW0CU21_9AGAR